MRSFKSFVPLTKQLWKPLPKRYFSSFSVLHNENKPFSEPPHVRMAKNVKDINPTYKEPFTTGEPNVNRGIPSTFEALVGKERVEMMFPEVWEKLLPEVVAVELGDGHKLSRPVLVPTWGNSEAIIGCVGDCYEKDIDYDSTQFKWTVLDANTFGICAQCGLIFYAINPDQHEKLEISREAYQWVHRTTKELIKEAQEILKDEEGFNERFTKFKERYNELAPFFATNMYDFYRTHSIVDFPKAVIPKKGESNESISFETVHGDSKEGLQEFIRYNTNIVLLKLGYPLFDIALKQIRDDAPTPTSPLRIHQQIEDIQNGKSLRNVDSIEFEKFGDYVKQVYEQYASQASKHSEQLHRTAEGLAKFFKINYGKDISLSNTGEAFEAMYQFICEEGWPTHLELTEKIEKRRKSVVNEQVEEEIEVKEPQNVNIQILFA